MLPMSPVLLHAANAAYVSRASIGHYQKKEKWNGDVEDTSNIVCWSVEGKSKVRQPVLSQAIVKRVQSLRTSILRSYFSNLCPGMSAGTARALYV